MKKELRENIIVPETTRDPVIFAGKGYIKT
jgi:hypothetical protein